MVLAGTRTTVTPVGGVVHDERSSLGLHERVREERGHGVAVGRGQGVEGPMAADQVNAEREERVTCVSPHTRQGTRQDRESGVSGWPSRGIIAGANEEPGLRHVMAMH